MLGVAIISDNIELMTPQLQTLPGSICNGLGQRVEDAQAIR